MSAIALPPLWTPPKLWTAPWWRLPMWFAEGKQKVHTTSRKLRAGTLTSKVRVSTATATFCCHCCCPCKLATQSSLTVVLDGITNGCGDCGGVHSYQIVQSVNGTYALPKTGGAASCAFQYIEASPGTFTRNYFTGGACSVPNITDTQRLSVQVSCSVVPKRLAVTTGSAMLMFAAEIPEDMDCDDMVLDNVLTTHGCASSQAPWLGVDVHAVGAGGTATITF